jgi:hypothetical protein
MGWKTEGLDFKFQQGQEFSLLNILQTSSGAHPAFYPMGTRVFSPKSKEERA